ncbi:AI-2E family transporter [Qipengyuania sp. JC766]|uniref:AI-2E family transporter n=1 Tax=Qipengyuania sp. JC766 TaxID=3232139 RepID=UPI003457B460
MNHPGDIVGGEEELGSSPSRITNPKLRFEAQRAIIWSLIVGGFILAIYVSQALLVVFGALVLASMIDGGARLLGRIMPGPRFLRVGLILLAATSFLIWLAYFTGTQVVQQAAELPGIVEQQAARVVLWARANGFEIGLQELQSLSGQIVSGVGTVTAAFTGLIGGLTTIVLIVIIGIYIAFEPRIYERGVGWITPRNHRKDLAITLDRMGYTMRRLMAGRLLGMVVEGVFTWLMLTLFDFPMAILLGILTGLLAFIPNIGALVSGVLMVAVGFSEGTEYGLYAIFTYFLVQTIDGYVLIPLIAKKTVDLPPALVLAWQLIMGLLFGIIGLFLADPMLAMLKVVLERRAERHQALDDEAAGQESLIPDGP